MKGGSSMSHKKAKQSRKLIKQACQKLEPIFHIACEELNHDPDEIKEWVAAASFLINVFPELPSEDFLPSQIDNVGGNWVKDFSSKEFSDSDFNGSSNQK